MATNGNERYLRYILLLGEGVLLVLRGITKREVARTGSTLKAILSTPSNRMQLESNCSSSVQRLQLFPSPAFVNDDINTWDISLLTLVLERVFWSHLSQSERLQIGYLRNCRNALQGHPPAMSMDETFYTTSSTDLSTVLQNLASRVNQQTTDELARIINNSNSVRFDFHAAIYNLQQLYEFKEDMLKELEKQFKAIDNKLDTTQAENKQKMSDIATVQDHMHEDILDIKGQGTKTSAVASQILQTVDDVKGDVDVMKVNQQERHEQLGTQLQDLQMATVSSQQDIAEIKKKLEELLLQRRPNMPDIQQDVDTTMTVDSDTQEHATDAQEIIFTTICDIIEPNRPDILENRENAEVLEERVRELVSRDGGNKYDLILALLELIKDILQHGSIQQVRKGSIKIIVRFTSYECLLKFIQYLSSSKLQQSLKDISIALKRMMGHTILVSANIAQESISDLDRHLAEECEKLKRTRKIVLPVQCKNIEDLNNIWMMLQMGGATEHMERISDILTKMVGGKTTLTTSVNLKQFQQALCQISDEQFSSDNDQPKRLSAEVEMHSASDMLSYELHATTSSAAEEHPLIPTEHRIPLRTESLYQGQSEKEDDPAEQARQGMLKFKSVEKHSVKDSGDKRTPFMYGSCVIPTGEILLIDKNNKKVKKLDSSFKLVSYCGLPGTPLDVCYVGKNRAAVSLAPKSVQFVNVLDGMYLDGIVKCDHACTGVACNGDILYVTDSSNTVYSYTTDGADNQILSKMPDEHVMIKHITTSEDGEMIYVATKKVGLVTIDKKGNHMSTLKTDILSFPTDVCVVGDGTILVTDFYSDNVLQVDYRGEEVLQNVASLLPGLEHSQKVLSYDKQHSKLIVGGLNEYVQVFEFQN